MIKGTCQSRLCCCCSGWKWTTSENEINPSSSIRTGARSKLSPGAVTYCGLFVRHSRPGFGRFIASWRSNHQLFLFLSLSSDRVFRPKELLLLLTAVDFLSASSVVTDVVHGRAQNQVARHKTITIARSSSSSLTSFQSEEHNVYKQAPEADQEMERER